MGLRNDIQIDIGKAFDTDLADAVKSLTLTQIVSDYDLLAGIATNAETPIVTRGVVYNSRNIEIFGEATQPTDVKIIILQNELSVIPKIDDYIETTVTKYKITVVKEDPAKATWELWCKV